MIWADGSQFLMLNGITFKNIVMKLIHFIAIYFGTLRGKKNTITYIFNVNFSKIDTWP